MSVHDSEHCGCLIGYVLFLLRDLDIERQRSRQGLRQRSRRR